MDSEQIFALAWLLFFCGNGDVFDVFLELP